MPPRSKCRGGSGHREAAFCIGEIQVREIGCLNQGCRSEHHHAEMTGLAQGLCMCHRSVRGGNGGSHVLT